MENKSTYRVNRQTPVVIKDTDDSTRASGDCICQACGFDYFSHRKVTNEQGEPMHTYRQLCNLTFVKL